MIAMHLGLEGTWARVVCEDANRVPLHGQVERRGPTKGDHNRVYFVFKGVAV